MTAPAMALRGLSYSERAYFIGEPCHHMGTWLDFVYLRARQCRAARLREDEEHAQAMAILGLT